MSRFSFRVYCNPTKSYVTDFGGLEFCLLQSGKLKLPPYIADDVYTVEQSTGLLDVDGKEIFEGDVCLSQGRDEHIVFWNKGNSCFEMTGWAGFPTQETANGYELKVIGNVHEVKDEG